MIIESLILIPCGNPRITEAIVHGRRYNNKSDIPDVIVDGKKKCCWCGVVDIKPPKRRYCSEICEKSATLMMAPQADDGVGFLLLRQDLKCNSCGYSWEEGFNRALKKLKDKNYKISWFMLGRWTKTYCELKNPHPQFDSWKVKECDGVNLRRMEIHHIITVEDEGDCFGVDNIELLCEECHKGKHKKKT